MKKFIAPRGEKGAPELRTVLASIASSASKAGGFIERKLAGWKPEQQAELATELWNGTEPVFTELMEAFHCAMENLQNLAGENHEAQHLVEKIPSLKRESENTRYVLWALKIASREADEWLASHPGEKAFWLDQVIDRLTSKPPGVLLATIIIVAGYAHYAWWVYRGRKRIAEDD